MTRTVELAVFVGFVAGEPSLRGCGQRALGVVLKGEKIFQTYCAACRSPQGKGEGAAAAG